MRNVANMNEKEKEKERAGWERTGGSGRGERAERVLQEKEETQANKHTSTLYIVSTLNYIICDAKSCEFSFILVVCLHLLSLFSLLSFSSSNTAAAAIASTFCCRWCWWLLVWFGYIHIYIMYGKTKINYTKLEWTRKGENIDFSLLCFCRHRHCCCRCRRCCRWCCCCCCYCEDSPMKWK